LTAAFATALLAGLVSTFTAGFVAALIAVLAGAFKANFGAALRVSFVTVLVAITALRDPPYPDFRAAIPLGRLKDIIPSDSAGRFMKSPRNRMITDSDVKEY
jgi:hypothetical protein